jgi:hypothetical protein
MIGTEANLSRDSDNLRGSDCSIRTAPWKVRHVSYQQTKQLAKTAYVTNRWYEVSGDEGTKSLGNFVVREAADSNWPPSGVQPLKSKAHRATRWFITLEKLKNFSSIRMDRIAAKGFSDCVLNPKSGQHEVPELGICVTPSMIRDIN